MAENKEHDIVKMEAEDDHKSTDGGTKGEGVSHSVNSTMENVNKPTQKHSADLRLTASRSPSAKQDVSSNLSNVPPRTSTPDASSVGYDETLLSAAHLAGSQTEAVSDELQQQSPSAPPNLQACDQNEDAETNDGSTTADAESMLSLSPASRVRRPTRTRTRSGPKRLEREIENFLEDAPVRTRVPSVAALDFDDDHGRVRMTRNAKKNLQLLTENKPLSPPPDMNLRRLVYKQFSDIRDRKVFDNVNVQDKPPDGKDEDGDSVDSEEPYRPRIPRSRANKNAIEDPDTSSENNPQRSKLMRGSKLRAIRSIQELAADAQQTTGSRIAEPGNYRGIARRVSTQKHRSRSGPLIRSRRTVHDKVNRSESPEGAVLSSGPRSENPLQGNTLSSTCSTAASAAESAKAIKNENDAPYKKDDKEPISRDSVTQTPTFASKKNDSNQSEAEHTASTLDRTVNQVAQPGPADQAMDEEQEQPQQVQINKRKTMSPLERPQKKIRAPPTV